MSQTYILLDALMMSLNHQTKRQLKLHPAMSLQSLPVVKTFYIKYHNMPTIFTVAIAQVLLQT